MNTEQQIINLLFKKRKLILFSIISFAILSIVTTFFIPKKYESIAIVFPNKTNSLEKVMNEPEFGYEIHSDRLIQIFESQMIKDCVVNKFNLNTYYELDTNSLDWRYKLNKYYEEDIRFSKTKYLSVEIKVETKNSKLSANIANYIVRTVDIINNNILKKNNRDALFVFRKKYDSQKIVVDSILNLIYNLPQSNIKQKDELLERRKIEIDEKNRNGQYSDIDNLVKSIKNSSGKVTEKLLNDYYFEKNSLLHFRQLYKKAQEKLETSLPKIFVVSEAVENPKKTSPSFLLNLLIGIGLGFFCSVLYVLITNKLTEINA